MLLLFLSIYRIFIRTLIKTITDECLKNFLKEKKNTMSMQEKINSTSDAKLRESAMLKMYKNDKNFRADKLNDN